MSTIPSVSAQEQCLVLYSTVRTRIQDALNKYQHGFCDRKGCKWRLVLAGFDQLERELNFVTFSKAVLRGNRNVLFTKFEKHKVGYFLTQRPAFSVNFWCKNKSPSFLPLKALQTFLHSVLGLPSTVLFWVCKGGEPSNPALHFLNTQKSPSAEAISSQVPSL